MLYNTHKLCGEDPAEGINRRLFRYEEEDSMKKQKISDAVIHRLPRYYRYLDDLYNKGVVRISSSSLGDKMDITASQIRQDLSCFGEFGQQGELPLLYRQNLVFLLNILELVRKSKIYRSLIQTHLLMHYSM